MLMTNTSSSKPLWRSNSRFVGFRRVQVFRVVSIAFAVVLSFFLFLYTSHQSNASLKRQIMMMRGEHKELHLPHCHSPCLQKFGKNGSWIQDWDFAELYGQYEEPWIVPPSNLMRRKELRFRPQDDTPFRWPTSWKWVDAQPSCPVVPLIQIQMCEVLQNLNISRIVFFGDSMTRSHYMSFLNLMGSRHITELGSVAQPVDTRTLLCNNTEATVNSTIRLFYKGDTGGTAFPQSERTNYTLSGDSDLMNFIHHDDSTPQRALCIFNIGAHYHNVSWYVEDMAKMLEELGSLARSQDLYFFRTTSSGHRNAINRRTVDWTKGTREKPFESWIFSGMVRRKNMIGICLSCTTR